MIIDNALNIAFSYLVKQYEEAELNLICDELRKIACAEEFEFSIYNGISGEYAVVQEKLSKLNEKESIRKTKGVYYTPNDVVRFILHNSIKAAFSQLTPESISKGNIDAVPYDSFCTTKTIFDPTCGAGEYLLAALNMKVDLLEKCGVVVSNELIQQVVSTIKGNDSNYDSITITKIRLLLCVVHKYGAAYTEGLACILNDGFESYDYITDKSAHDEKYDVIVGNPPYVEDYKSGLLLEEKYGNIYANVLINAAKQLKIGGSMGFIVPLSYISTPRMKKLRNALFALIPEQYILSYADRPDCLFDSVHQKLCIIIGKSGDMAPTVYTGNYRYWYKSERSNLFDRTTVIKNDFCSESFIPKLGCSLDVSIYRKITDPSKVKSVYAQSRHGTESVFLNRRETFWMKAYREYVADPEYKVFSYATASEADYCYCLINSSLFWWYWISVSDCWHVSKELNGFMAPDNPDDEIVTRLASQLRQRLEETKVYVGTVQTEYEYKHRDCLAEIQAIDDFINNLYGLTAEESDYIKGFALKYRTSGGA